MAPVLKAVNERSSIDIAEKFEAHGQGLKVLKGEWTLRSRAKKEVTPLYSRRFPA